MSNIASIFFSSTAQPSAPEKNVGISIANTAVASGEGAASFRQFLFPVDPQLGQQANSQLPGEQNQNSKNPLGQSTESTTDRLLGSLVSNLSSDTESSQPRRTIALPIKATLDELSLSASPVPDTKQPSIATSSELNNLLVAEPQEELQPTDGTVEPEIVIPIPLLRGLRPVRPSTDQLNPSSAQNPIQTDGRFGSQLEPATRPTASNAATSNASEPASRSLVEPQVLPKAPETQLPKTSGNTTQTDSPKPGVAPELVSRQPVEQSAHSPNLTAPKPEVATSPTAIEKPQPIEQPATVSEPATKTTTQSESQSDATVNQSQIEATRTSDSIAPTVESQPSDKQNETQSTVETTATTNEHKPVQPSSKENHSKTPVDPVATTEAPVAKSAPASTPQTPSTTDTQPTPTREFLNASEQLTPNRNEANNRSSARPQAEPSFATTETEFHPVHIANTKVETENTQRVEPVPTFQPVPAADGSRQVQPEQIVAQQPVVVQPQRTEQENKLEEPRVRSQATSQRTDNETQQIESLEAAEAAVAIEDSEPSAEADLEISTNDETVDFEFQVDRPILKAAESKPSIGQSIAGYQLATPEPVLVAKSTAMNNTMTPVLDPQITDSVIQQVAESTFRLVKDSVGDVTQKLTLQIHPAELGFLEVHVESQDEIVRAHIVASEHTTNELLNREKHTLIQSLQEIGIEVNEVEISHRENFQTGEQGKQKDYEFQDWQFVDGQSDHESNDSQSESSESQSTIDAIRPETGLNLIA